MSVLFNVFCLGLGLKVLILFLKNTFPLDVGLGLLVFWSSEDLDP